MFQTEGNLVGLPKFSHFYFANNSIAPTQLTSRNFLLRNRKLYKHAELKIQRNSTNVPQFCLAILNSYCKK